MTTNAFQFLDNVTQDSPLVSIVSPPPVLSIGEYKEQLLERCNKDWGEPPRYNAEYRSIRWPKKEGVRTPDWKGRIIRELRKKTNRLWTYSSRSPLVKSDTETALMADLKFCMRENIPFKTKTLEYHPRDQWVYILGNRVLKYDILLGVFSHFTYSGVYDKRISFFLRRFGIRVTKQKGGLFWDCYFGNTVLVPIDLNREYSLIMYNDEGKISTLLADIINSRGLL